jgi:signal transduction histidine kinase
MLGAAVFVIALVEERKAEKNRQRREYYLLSQKELAEQANRAKSEFLSNVSHELRTPLHAILSYSKMGFTRNREESSKIERYFRNIYTSGQRLLDFIDNLLDLEKLESGKFRFDFEWSNFLEVIEIALAELEPLLKEKNIQASQDTDTACIHAFFDRKRMVQVMVNLISNAAKFSCKGSTILIRLSDGISPLGREAIFCSVADDGTCIPANELESVFDKFVQSSATKSGAGGAGLGLSICREIVEVHGGKIWAENAKPKGTVFNFIIARDGLAVPGHGEGVR